MEVKLQVSYELVVFRNIPVHVHLSLKCASLPSLATGVQRLVTQEEAGGGEGRRDRLSRRTGGGEDGGAAEGDVGAAAAAGQGALGSNADGGAGEATGWAAGKEALCGVAASRGGLASVHKELTETIQCQRAILISATVARWQLVVLTDLPV